MVKRQVMVSIGTVRLSRRYPGCDDSGQKILYEMAEKILEAASIVEDAEK